MKRLFCVLVLALSLAGCEEIIADVTVGNVRYIEILSSDDITSKLTIVNKAIKEGWTFQCVDHDRYWFVRTNK